MLMEWIVLDDVIGFIAWSFRWIFNFLDFLTFFWDILIILFF